MTLLWVSALNERNCIVHALDAGAFATRQTDATQQPTGLPLITDSLMVQA